MKIRASNIFSGTANYKTMVNLKSIPNAKVYLDLGGSFRNG